MSATQRHCPLLERPAPSAQLHAAPSPWQLRRCTETGFVFLANPPAQAQFQDEYAWEVTHEREADRRRKSEPAIHAMSTALKTFRQRFLKRDKVATMLSRTIEQCASRKPSGTVRLVDVGCAYGTLAVRVATMLPDDVARRLEPIGIEISNHLAAKADETLRKRGGRCLHGTAIEGLRALEAGHADVIVLSCILEHEIEPLELLRQCRARLAPHGRVIIKIPNYASLGRLIRGRKWCGYRWPDHVNYFTPRTLRMIAEAADLGVTRMNVFDRSPLSDSLYAVLGCDEAPRVARHRAA
jgi:2-polyprenyl-3-methyl-5-hydroxy-6-metoxy-1,4-benzoquinol methylase